MFNGDNSRFAIIWKTVVEDIEINYYDNLSQEMIEYNENIIKNAVNSKD